jgi:hypothetical protein
MADLEPTESRNLDAYGSADVPWSRAADQLRAGELGRHSSFVSTTRPDGRPHVTRVGAIWVDGDLYFPSNPTSRKSRNLAVNSAAAISTSLDDIDLSFEGKAVKVTDPAELERVAAIYRERDWPVEVAGDALTAPYNAPAAGTPPWDLIRFTFHTVFGGTTAEPYGAMRWRFER